MYYIGSMQCDPRYLEHFGIKGQKWGIRRYENEDGTLMEAGKERYSRQQHKLAKKDAKEYARAKMFYGEGAGTRRKLINKTVEQRSKDPVYKQHFDAELARQDMAKHAAGAKRERKVKDVEKGIGKTARGIRNLATGNIQYVGTAVLAAAAAVSVLHASGADKKIFDAGRDACNRIFRR